MIIRHTILRILNVISYFLLFGYHAKIWYLDEPKGEKDNHLTYFTPVQWADYTIWGLIHFLFFGFIFYQWFDSAAEQIIEGVSWHFIALSIFTSSTLFLWAADHERWALLLSLLLSSQISFTYFNLRKRYPADRLGQKIWIHAPFSVYHGWVAILTFVLMCTSFAPKPEDHKDEIPPVGAWVLVLISYFGLELTAWSYIHIAGEGDVIGALVIAFGLYGIAYQQDYIWFKIIGYTGSTFTILYPFLTFFKKYCGYGSETAPLLG